MPEWGRFPAGTGKEVARLWVPAQFHHGSADRAVGVAGTRELVKELTARKAALFEYEGADHGFLAHARPTYRPEDARVAWARTAEALKKHLTG